MKAVQHRFGERVRQLRKARGWSQEKLAERTNRHWTYIGGVERGERNPTLRVIADIAKALGVPIRELLPEGEMIRQPLVRIGARESDRADGVLLSFDARLSRPWPQSAADPQAWELGTSKGEWRRERGPGPTRSQAIRGACVGRPARRRRRCASLESELSQRPVSIP